MKHRTVATAFIFVLLLVFMIWSFASSAANLSSASASPGAADSAEANEVFQDNNQDNNEEDVDADLGKWGSGSRIDREEYLRLRGDYIARKRGIEPGFPFNPELRSDAINQMERQEKGRGLESIMSSDLTPAAGGAWTPIGPSPFRS
jgi:hypothetical protein